jgi:hypothetical protein
MKIIDGFLFNGEFEILKLRLECMAPYIDEFLIVECDKTFSGVSKPALLRDRLDEYSKFVSKIRYCHVTEIPLSGDAWVLEHYLRDQIRVLADAEDNDLVIISDVDEILYMENLTRKISTGVAQ